MYWKDTVILVKRKHDVDDFGDIIATETQKEIFCNESYQKQSDIFEAQAKGYKVEYSLQIRREDYEDEDRAIYEGKPLQIITVNRKSDEVVEIVLGSSRSLE